ncbi:MAG: HAMP domain-containing histidine kinase [Ignavibacteriales bacterium]|nr:HAMP domain-containing histidine kinase [Ignavibacteriales bacterium]
MEDLKNTSNSLKSELKRLSPLRTVRNENRIEFDISKSIKHMFSVYKLKLEKENIEFNANYNEDFQIYTRFTMLNQIIGNLIDNSIYWIVASGNKIKKIEIKLDKENRTLLLADTGTGIEKSIRPYLFEPGYSLKIPPSGLGLYICKYFMHSMNGQIHEVSSREKLSSLNGAQFMLEFENVPTSKEYAK